MFLYFQIDFQTEITKGLNTLTGDIEKWAIPLAAIGTVTMALIQAVKNITPIPNLFERAKLRSWLLTSIRRDYCLHPVVRFLARMQARLKSPPKEDRDAKGQSDVGQNVPSQWDEDHAKLRMVERDLITLATSGDREAFYQLAIEDLCDQIRKVVPVILDYPKHHEDLLACLARGASADDIREILTEQNSSASQSARLTTEEQKTAFRQFTAAKSRILVQMRCSIDAMQASISFRWKFWLQLASMVLSAIIGIVALNLGALPDAQGPIDLPSKFWASMMIGLLAGFLAPVARDLVAAIEKLRS
jgi:hypothetical protein